jgi:hypothetical protein
MFGNQTRIKMNCPILTWWLATCFVLVFAGSDCKLTSGEESLMVLREQTRKLLTTEATTTGSEAKRSAAHSLCDQYVVLRSDRRYRQSQDSSSQREPGLDARGGAAVADDGWSLIELIQRVIAPDFWEPQGVPGVIRYFAIKRALVVRATTDVHEQLRELLTALR